MIYLFGIGIVLLLISILRNSLLRSDYAIRRNMIKYVVGENKRNLILIECCKALIVCVLPIILSGIVLTISNNARKWLNSMPFMRWDGYLASIFVVVTSYTLCIATGFIKIIKAKPLDGLRRR